MAVSPCDRAQPRDDGRPRDARGRCAAPPAADGRTRDAASRRRQAGVVGKQRFTEARKHGSTDSHLVASVLLCFCASVFVFGWMRAEGAAGQWPAHRSIRISCFPSSPEGTSPAQTARIDRGWQYLQLDDHAQRRARVRGRVEAAAVVLLRPRRRMAYLAVGARQREGRRDAIRSRAAGGRRLTCRR